MMPEKIISDTLFSFIEAGVFLTCYITLADKRGFFKQNILKCILFTAFYIIFVPWGSIYIPFGIHTVCNFIFTIFLLSFLTRTNIYNSIIIVMLTAMFIGIIDIIVSGIFSLVIKVDLNQWLQDSYRYIEFASISKLVLIIFTILFYRFNNNRLKITIFKTDNSQYLYILIQLCILMIFVISINYNINRNINILQYNIFLLVLFILSLLLAFFDIKERERILNMLNKKKYLEEYVKNLEDVINVIRREKHEFSNHIQTVFAMCQLNKPDTNAMIYKYLSRLIGNMKSVYHFYETGNIYVDGLLAIKSNICFENDIALNVSINASFSSAAADDCDTAGIVGNIVNNAIECLRSYEEKRNKEISFETFVKYNHFHIRISNNGPQIPKPQIDRIFENGFTTKDNSADHGYGLYITKQLVSKNKGDILVTSSDELTTFEIIFGVKKESLNEADGGYAAG